GRSRPSVKMVFPPTEIHFLVELARIKLKVFEALLDLGRIVIIQVRAAQELAPHRGWTCPNLGRSIEVQFRIVEAVRPVPVERVSRAGRDGQQRGLLPSNE